MADFFTKPVQGGLFKKLRDQIMGITPIPIEERVVICDKDIHTNVENTIGLGVKGEEKEINETYAAIVKMGMQAHTKKVYVHGNNNRDFKNERTRSMGH